MKYDLPQTGPVELRRRSDACRALAAVSDTLERKSLWLSRANYWNELSLRAVERRLEAVKSKLSDDLTSTVTRAPIDCMRMLANGKCCF